MSKISMVGIFEAKDGFCTITVWYKSRRMSDYVGRDVTEALSNCPSSVNDFLNNPNLKLTRKKFGANISGKWYALGES